MQYKEIKLLDIENDLVSQHVLYLSFLTFMFINFIGGNNRYRIICTNLKEITLSNYFRT